MEELIFITTRIILFICIMVITYIISTIPEGELTDQSGIW
jgi:hypothetical protein